MSVPEIEVSQAQPLHASGGATFVDVRDPQSHANSRIPGSELLGDANIQSFLAEKDKSADYVIYCFRGNSSKAVVEHLQKEGFSSVKSLAGGFDAWAGANAPTERAPAAAPAAGAGEGVNVSAAALEKLKEYLASEDDGTAVRVTLEGARFGLALDEPLPSDVRYEVSGLTVVADKSLESAVSGLTIDWVRNGMSYGFALEGGTPPPPPGREDMQQDVKQRIADNRIMIFMKGTASQPMCGFSARAISALQSLGKPFGHKNVLEVPEYRYAVSAVSSWPTIPQIFIDGEFIGGCDILMEMHGSGELQKKVDEAFAKAD